MITMGTTSGSTSLNQVNYDQFFTWAYAVLLPYAQKQENDWDRAQDVIQETLVQVWQRGAVTACDTTMQITLIKQMRRVITMQLEQQRASGKALHTFEQAAAEKMASQEELLVSFAFLDLPDELRQVLELRYIDQLSFKETARVLGLNHNVLAKRLGVAVRHLKRGFEEYCPPEMPF
jgi:RNA polymerase sigma factor (sigma-70 family)